MLPPQGHLANQMAVFIFCQKINFSGRKEVSIASKPSAVRSLNPYQSSCAIMLLLLYFVPSISYFLLFRVVEDESMTLIKVCLTITKSK